MQMREKHSSHARWVDVQPGQTGREIPTCIKEEPLVTSGYQRADPQAFAAKCRSGHCAEKDDLQLGFATVGCHGLGTWRGEREDGRERNQRRESHAASNWSGCLIPYAGEAQSSLPSRGMAG